MTARTKRILELIRKGETLRRLPDADVKRLDKVLAMLRVDLESELVRQ